MKLGLWLFLFYALFLVGCVTTPAPYEDYTLAKVAIDSARVVQAARYSPGYWHQSEDFYRKAKVYFNDRDYEKAKEFFLKARLSAEKAENSARLLRQKNGDVL